MPEPTSAPPRLLTLVESFALTAAALALSMLADFTALPAALWIVFGARPHADLSH